MREILGQLADGQIEMYKTVREAMLMFFSFRRGICVCRVWRSGRGSFLLYNGSVWMSSKLDILLVLIYSRFFSCIIIFYHVPLH